MSDRCQQALRAIEADPLELPPEVQTHLDACEACREARVHWLAQEEAPTPLVPAGYFDHLPRRILRKLPSGRSRGTRPHTILWLAAGALALALGVGGYLAGRVQRVPMVEASLETVDPAELMTETPFDEGDDPISQLSEMSSEDAEAVLQRLESSPRP